MGDFPSGQRGQTVNLLAMPSVVRIHHRPFKNADVTQFKFIDWVNKRQSRLITNQLQK